MNLEAVLTTKNRTQPCLVVGETRTKYRVKAKPGEEIIMGGRRGPWVLFKEGTALVPKSAVDFGVDFGGIRAAAVES